jgi:hypothetical protein
VSTNQGIGEVTVTIAFLDDQGAEQFTILRTTVAAEVIRSRAVAMRASLERHYADMGCEILSVQARYETAHQLAQDHDHPQRSALRLVVNRNGLIALCLIGLMCLLAELGQQAFVLALCRHNWYG